MEDLFLDKIKNHEFGNVFLAADEAGLVAVSVSIPDVETFIDYVKNRFPCTIRKDAEVTEKYKTELIEYFEGKRKEFTVSYNLSFLTPFQQEVLQKTTEIPYGKTKSYRQIAEEINRPFSARAVGNALAANPVPVVVPCHRVISSSGKIGGFMGGDEKGPFFKRKLLYLEGIDI